VSASALPDYDHMAWSYYTELPINITVPGRSLGHVTVNHAPGAAGIFQQGMW
jgi:hypothetical protein